MNDFTKDDLDYLFNAVLKDSDALEDAKMTLEIIKKTDPNVYDEMIDCSLALIDDALSRSILGTLEKILGEDWFITNGVNNGK